MPGPKTSMPSPKRKATPESILSSGKIERRDKQKHVEFLRELLPPGTSPIEIDSGGIASSVIPRRYFSHAGGEEILLVSWGEEGEEVTLAGYLLPGGRCKHLWRGLPTEEGMLQAWEMFREEGLLLKRPEKREKPEKIEKPSEIEKRGGDILDMFG